MCETDQSPGFWVTFSILNEPAGPLPGPSVTLMRSPVFDQRPAGCGTRQTIGRRSDNCDKETLEAWKRIKDALIMVKLPFEARLSKIPTIQTMLRHLLRTQRSGSCSKPIKLSGFSRSQEISPRSRRERERTWHRNPARQIRSETEAPRRATNGRNRRPPHATCVVEFPEELVPLGAASVAASNADRHHGRNPGERLAKEDSPLPYTGNVASRRNCGASAARAGLHRRKVIHSDARHEHDRPSPSNRKVTKKARKARRRKVMTSLLSRTPRRPS